MVLKRRFLTSQLRCSCLLLLVYLALLWTCYPAKICLWPPKRIRIATQMVLWMVVRRSAATLLLLYWGHHTVCMIIEGASGLEGFGCHGAVRPEPNIILQTAWPAWVCHDSVVVSDGCMVGRAEHVGRFLFIHYDLLHVDLITAAHSPAIFWLRLNRECRRVQIVNRLSSPNCIRILEHHDILIRRLLLESQFDIATVIHVCGGHHLWKTGRCSLAHNSLMGSLVDIAEW